MCGGLSFTEPRFSRCTYARNKTSNGPRAAMHSKRTMPIEYTSVRASTRPPRNCSGATYFGVPNLDDAIADVLQDARTELNGHPALQWQSITKVMGSEGEPTVQIMFLWVATVQPEWVFECLGMLRFPVNASPEEQAAASQQMEDLASVVESFRVR